MESSNLNDLAHIKPAKRTRGLSASKWAPVPDVVDPIAPWIGENRIRFPDAEDMDKKRKRISVNKQKKVDTVEKRITETAKLLVESEKRVAVLKERDAQADKRLAAAIQKKNEWEKHLSEIDQHIEARKGTATQNMKRILAHDLTSNIPDNGEKTNGVDQAEKADVTATDDNDDLYPLMAAVQTISLATLEGGPRATSDEDQVTSAELGNSIESRIPVEDDESAMLTSLTVSGEPEGKPTGKPGVTEGDRV